jgi:hypothetical protein
VLRALRGVNDKSAAKSIETTANENLLHFIFQLPQARKDDEFGREQLIGEDITLLGARGCNGALIECGLTKAGARWGARYHLGFAARA